MTVLFLLRRLGLRTKTVLVLSGWLTLGLILVGALVTLRSRQDMAEQADQRALNLAYAAGQEIGDAIASHDRQLRAVVRRLPAPGALTRSPAPRQPELFGSAGRVGHFDFINVLNDDGAVVADSGSAARKSANWRNRDYFQAQLGNPHDALFVGKPFEVVRDALGVMPLSRRRTDASGNFAGVVVGMMRLSSITGLLRRSAPGAHGTIMLLRDDGMMLQRVPAAAREIGSILSDPRLKTPSIDPRRLNDPVDHAVRRYVTIPVTGLPLLVTVGSSAADTFAGWWRRAEMALSAMVILWLFNLGLLMALYTQLRSKAIRARYLAMLGHEVRGPAQHILFCAEAMQQSDGTPEFLAGNAKAIADECSHLHDVLGQLFDYARVESRSDAPAQKHEPLDALVRKCVSSVSHTAAGHGLQLAVRIDPNVSSWIQTDATRLQVILRNLLNNAIHYTEQGSVSLRVTRDGATLCFAVADTGSGIPEQLRDRLARPFDRLDRDDDADGTGLGLSIAALLACELGGRLEYMPNPPAGSIFCLRLPLVTADPDLPAPERDQSLVAPGWPPGTDALCSAPAEAAQRPQEPRSGESRSDIPE